MSDNYVVYHLHSDCSLLDSATKFYKYLDRAKQLEMKAIAFSEHGNVFNWMKKKEEIEKRGMKYIHAMEAYVTANLDEKVRDNYHMMFIAKNYEGVKELNKMSSKAYYKHDGHFYYDARFTIDEVMATSDNILITTSCLGGIFAKGNRNGEEDVVFKFLDWALHNKHRVFLEIQYHNYGMQIDYNHYLYNLHKEYGFQLIAGTDTHALDERYARGRKILMQAKGMQFQDEDKFDLTFKSYSEIIGMFKRQNRPHEDDYFELTQYKLDNESKLLPQQVYIDAIEFTNNMAGMIEEFKLDKSPKYPKIYDNPEQVFKDKINEGVIKRGIASYETKKRKQYFKVIQEEYAVYDKLHAIDYMLFQKDVIEYAHSKGIYHGYGRGSVNGSLIAYILGITEMDSVRHRLNFFRFMNPSRISLADIDIDWPPSKRQDIIDYVASKNGIYFSEIITFNTIALKGAIREVGRALKMDLPIVDEIAKNVEEREDFYRDKFPELFEYVDLLNGVNVSVGSHPSGFVVSPIPLDESIGLFYTSESKYPVSQVNMKELDGNNFVKLDILGLSNIELINTACDLAGIERLTPDNVDVYDESVWQSIRESTLGIFQWESDSAFAYYKELFRPETLQKIKILNPNISYINLFSIANGAIRPSGDSYRGKLANGIFNDNGHESLNDFLKDTLGYLVYQEQIMNWLVDFCGFDGAESDSVRRGIAKKEDTQQFLVPIENGFLKTMESKYGITADNAREILQSFLRVIDSASDYGFSVNHSDPYSYCGYACAYLRHYYPLEFLATMLNLAEKIEEIGEITAYAQSRGIKVSGIRFGRSVAQYSFSKEENSIFKGLKSIKYLSEKISTELLDLSKKKYDCFVDLLVDIDEKTSVNSKQLNILIMLSFFKDFGSIGKLLNVSSEFSEGKNRYDKKHKEATKQKRTPLLREYEASVEDQKLDIYDVMMFEKEHLGYIETKFPEIKEEYAMILDIDKKYTPKVTLYNLRTGKEKVVKVAKKNFYDKKDNETLFVGDIIKIKDIILKPKKKLVDGKWHDLEEREPFLDALKLVQRRMVLLSPET